MPRLHLLLGGLGARLVRVRVRVRVRISTRVRVRVRIRLELASGSKALRTKAPRRPLLRLVT